MIHISYSSVTGTVGSLASPSSVDTDHLSCLGVRLREWPDPLADWEDLEPELDTARRSLCLDNSFASLIRKPSDNTLVQRPKISPAQNYN